MIPQNGANNGLPVVGQMNQQNGGNGQLSGGQLMPQNGDLMALKWMSKWEVNVLSTFHNIEMKTITSYCGEKQKPLL